MLGYSTAPAIDANSTSNISKSVTIPVGTPPGDYYIILYSDAGFDIDECDELNNRVAIPITVIPAFIDLELISMSLTPQAAYPGYFNNGVAISGNMSIKNTGNSNYSGNGTCKVWFSSDSILGLNDLLVQTSNNSINYGTTSNLSFSYTPPFNVTAGTYYFIFEADANNLFTEPNENNNFDFIPVEIQESYHDLEAVDLTNLPSSFNFINSYTLQAKIRNNGRINTSSTYPFEYQILLSADSIFDVNDVVLNYLNTSSSTVINNITNYNISIAFNNINYPPGPAYLILFVDSENRHSEIDENNNTFAVPIIFPDVTFDDTPTNITVANQLQLGVNFTIGSTIKNNGTYKKTGCSVSYYISTDTTFDANDYLLGTQSSTSNANPLASYTLSNINANIPPMIIPGNYYILGIADANNNLIETNESNNKIFDAVNVSNFLPDVKINSLSAPNSLCNNGLNNISITIANSGSTTAVNFNVEIYLSNDTIYDANDIVIYNAAYSNLNAGSTATITTYDYNVAPTYSIGTNYILAYVNRTNSINEYSLLNNKKYKSANVTSCSIDIISQNGNTVNANQGSNSSMSFTIKNDGLASATSINFGYYLSSDNVLDANDNLIYSGSTGLMHDNATLNTSYNYPVPLSMPIGNYYVFFVTDTNNLYIELNESNNIISDLFTVTVPNVGPDLGVQSAVLNSSTIGAGNYGGGGYVDLRNYGNVTATSSNVGIYLSTNNSYSSNDVFIGSFSGGTITSGATLTYTAGYEFLIPFGTVPGSYYLLYYIDHDSLVTEYNETNNVYSKSVTIIVANNDVKIILDGFPNDTLFSGHEYEYSSYLKNIGNCAYFHPTITYYLSTDSIPDNTDLVLGEYSGYTLSSGSSSNPSSDIIISNSIPDGYYYFIYHVDTDSLLSETNELNNIIAIPFYLKKPYADLDLQNYATNNPTLLTTATTYNFSFTSSIRNIGETAASSSIVRFYISTDTIIDAGDLVLGTSSGSSLNPALTYTNRTISNINNISLPPGNYYMIHFVDPNNTVIELNESNNIRYYPLIIYPQYIDLISQNNSFNYDTVSQTSVLPITSGIYNNGTTNSGNTDLRIVLSTDTIYDISDIILYSNSYSQVNRQVGYNVSTNLTIPSTVSGDYFVLVFADPDDDQIEWVETNNILFYPLHILPKTYEFFTSFESISSDTLIGGISYTHAGVIFNTGNAACSNILLKTYLSLDTLFSINDVLLTNSGQSISAYSGNSYNTNFTMPNSISGGNYYILFISDETDLYTELDENNNLKYRPIFVKSDGVDVAVFHGYNTADFIPGTTVNIIGNVVNYGNVAANTFIVSAYLSTDSLYSTSPNYFLGQSSNSVSIYGVNNLSIPITSFLSVPAGTYYLILKADSNNNITETNENNNLSVTQVEVLEPEIDLIPFNLSAPTLTNINNTITVNYSFMNNYPFTNLVDGKFYISQDSTFDGSDIYLNQFSTTTTAGINSSTISLNIPGNLVTNFYYLIFVLDETNTIFESNELNNSMCTPIYIEHNFLYNFGTITNQIITACSGTIYDYGGPDEPYFNASTSMMTIQSGSSTSKVKLDFLYFVNDVCCDYLKIFDGPDTLSPVIGTFTTNPGIVFSSHSTGSLTLLLKSDSANVASGFAANISCVVPGVDLLVDNVIINPDTINDNTITNIQFDILNNGIASSVATNAKIFISSDSLMDASDVLLANVPVSSIAGLGSNQYSQNITPNVTMSGVYYILVYVDHDLLISEAVENNNMDWNYLYIQNADTTFDISINNCSLSSLTIPKGTYFDANVELINNFTAVGNHHFKVYLSVDAIVSGNDLTLDDYIIPGINATSSYNFIRNILMPGTITTGTYYIILLEDANNDYVEINEVNNKFHYSVNVSEPNDINETVEEHLFNLFPNPANDNFYLNYLGNDTFEHQNISIYDVTGNLIFELSNQMIQNNSIIAINTSDFAKGIYYVQIGSLNKTNPLKLIIMH
jgi:subtilase family serine protease